MKIAVLQAFVIYGIAFVISMLIALLITGLFRLVRRISGSS